MVFVNVRAGRLANRLIHFSHFIVNSIEYDYRLAYPYFQEYSRYFNATTNNFFNNYKISIKLTRFCVVDRLLMWIIKILSLPIKRDCLRIPFMAIHSTLDLDKNETKFDLNNNEYISIVRKKLTFINGWGYRDYKNWGKYAPLLREFFQPKKQITEEIDRIISNCKQKGDIIVGIHIRKGDYKSFKLGKWYYNGDIYAGKMKSFENIFKGTGKKCVFLLCSDETIQPDQFSGLSIVAERRHSIVDLYALTKCDYIIGPPSTFTIWASFYGNVPLFMLNNPDSEIYLNGFRIMKEF